MTRRRLVAALGAVALAATTCIAASVIQSAPATAESLTTGNGLAATPPMGWSSWSSLENGVSATKMKAEADAMVSSGLAAVGYNYVNLDDYWYDCPRTQPVTGPPVDQSGFFVPNSKFPPVNGVNGIQDLASYVHGKGLKFGFYLTPGMSRQAYTNPVPIRDAAGNVVASTAGIVKLDSSGQPVSEINYNCTPSYAGSMVALDFTKPGAQQFLDNWAKQLAGWGVDYLKLDGVGTYDEPDIEGWSKALAASGRPIHLELSNALAISAASEWQTFTNGWRTGGDIECYSAACNGTLTTWNYVDLRFPQVGAWQPYGAPGNWNDYDSIEVGNGAAKSGITADEEKSQLNLWALASSPLLLGTDLTKLDPTDLPYLKNKNVIAVDQDSIAATEVVAKPNQAVYAKTEPNGDVILGLFNPNGSASQTVSVDLGALGINGSATATDLWTGTASTISGTYSVNLGAGASTLLRIVPLSGGFTTYQAEASNNVLAGSAAAQTSCTYCYGGAKVGNLGNGGTLTFANVSAPVAGTYKVTVVYEDGTSGTTGRSVSISANNGPAAAVTVTPSGQWSTGWTGSYSTTPTWKLNGVAPGTATVSLDLKAGSNSISFSNGSEYAPDIDAIIVPTGNYEAESSLNTVTGIAGKATCASCSGGNKIGWIGSGTTSSGAPVSGTLTFNNVYTSSAGDKTVLIGYATSGARSLTISVNGTTRTVTAASTGSYATPGRLSVTLPLKAGNNSIQLSNASGWAPDVDSLGVN